MKNIICPFCGSSNTLYRQTDKKHWCRKCGKEFELRENKDVTEPDKPST